MDNANSQGAGDKKRSGSTGAQKPPSLTPHVPPDQRARVAASNAVARVYGLSAEEDARVSYYTSELIQCTLPHSDPQTRDWIRKNGTYALIISSGVDENAAPFGVPYGSFPRLVLAHIITRTIATRERRIELSSHFATFLREIGYTGNHKGNGIKAQRVRDQLLRLLNASISFQYHDERRLSRLNLNIAPRFDLWWDFKKPEEDSLFGSWIELSEDFYQTILDSPVPLSTRVLKELRKSPLALDIYMWLSHRLFRMQAAGQKELTVSYGALQEQFGTGISDENYRQFRAEFRLAIKKVAAEWKPDDQKKEADDEKKKANEMKARHVKHKTDGENESEGEKRKPDIPDDTTECPDILLKFQLQTTGLTLFDSPLLVSRGARLTTQEQATQIVEGKRFDAETRKKAQLKAGTWSVTYLEQQYFAWIKSKGITPKNPNAHFLSFITRHRRLHKEVP